MRHIITFDVETQHTANEVGGWKNIRDMKLAVAVTFNSANQLYRDYDENHVDELIATLCSADLVVGYNVLRFDYEVLQPYTDTLLSNIRTVDMLQDLYQTLGWRPKLDDIALATLGEKKTADGLQAVRWFRQGKLDKVTAYCIRMLKSRGKCTNTEETMATSNTVTVDGANRWYLSGGRSNF